MGSLTPGTLFLTMRSLLTLVLAIAALAVPSERAAAQGAVKSVHTTRRLVPRVSSARSCRV